MYKKKVYFLQNYIHYSRQFVNVPYSTQLGGKLGSNFSRICLPRTLPFPRIRGGVAFNDLIGSNLLSGKRRIPGSVDKSSTHDDTHERQ